MNIRMFPNGRAVDEYGTMGRPCHRQLGGRGSPHEGNLYKRVATIGKVPIAFVVHHMGCDGGGEADGARHRSNMMVPGAFMAVSGLE